MFVINSTVNFVLIILMGLVVTVVLLLRYGWKNAIQDAGTPDKDGKPSGLDFQGHVQAGNRLYQDYRYKEALEHYLEASKLNNRDPMIHYRIGRIYESLEDYAHAETAFQNVLSITPESVEAQFELSRIYFKESKLDLALKCANQLMDLSPEYEEGTKLKVRILLEMNDFRTAGDLLEELLKTDPENSDLVVLLGKTYQKAEQWEEALTTYQNLLDKDLLDRKNLKFQIVQIHCKQANFDKAIEVLEDILDTGTGTMSRDVIKTELAKCWCKKAVEAFQAGEYGIAAEFYNKALAINPDLAEIYTGLAKVHVQQEERDLALLYYQKALELGYQNTHAYMEMATLYEQMDQYEDAIDCMLKAEVLLPTAQVYYYLGTLFGLNGDLDNCITYLNKATYKDAKFIDAYYNLGVALEQQKKFKEAMGMYRRVLELNKHHIEAKTNYKHLQSKAR